MNSNNLSQPQQNNLTQATRDQLRRSRLDDFYESRESSPTANFHRSEERAVTLTSIADILQALQGLNHFKANGTKYDISSL